MELCGEKHSNNYSSWKVQMLSLIKSHDLLGFIDGTIIPPSAVDENSSRDEYDKWRTDMTVRGWILATVSEPTLLSPVADLSTAREVWSQLEFIFTKPCYPLPKSEAQKEYGEDNILDEHTVAKEGVKLMLQDINSVETSIALIQAFLGKPPTAIMTMLEFSIGQGSKQFLDTFLSTNSQLCLKNHQGSTLLHIAAAVGNMPVAKSLVQKFNGLCYVYDNSGDFPIHYAALHQQKDMIRYLLSVPRDDESPDPYAPAPGLKLLLYLTEAHFFDIAMELVEKYPKIAWHKDSDGNSALPHIIERWNTVQMNFWQRIVSSCLPVPTRSISSRTQNDDLESNLGDTNQRRVSQDNIIWKYLNHLREKRLANGQALELIKLLAVNIRTSDNFEIFGDAFVKAAEFHLQEVFRVLVDTFPPFFCIYCLPSMQYLITASVESHCMSIVYFIHEISHHKYLYSKPMDSNNNNVLHLAAKLAPSHRLNRITGAALQMQYEIKWFKYVTTLVHPHATLQRNNMGQTPEMVFMEQHNNLKNDGEKWMKETANSCTIAAALIATVMFAAAITVPGGNDANNGYPFFVNKKIFTLFAISDAASLFASIVSLLMFLYILTSRYEVNDFLDILPTTLLIGLAMLFLSIAFMMVSFSATLYFVFGQERAWVLATSMGLSFVPIFVFARLQYRILVDLVSFFCKGKF